MSAGHYNFTIEQSVQFTTVFKWQDDDGNPIDITGMAPAMQIRESQSKTSPLIEDLTSYLTIDAPHGAVTLSIPGSATDDFDFDTGHYSLRLGQSARIIEGVVTLSRETSA